MVCCQNNFLVFYLLYISIATISCDSNGDSSSNENRIIKSDINDVINKTKLDMAINLASTIGTHVGREQVIEYPYVKTVTTTNSSSVARPDKTKPVHETVMQDLDVAPHQDDGKPSVAKKGVHFSDLDQQVNKLGDVDIKLNKTNSINNGIDNNLKNIFNITNSIKNSTSNNSSSVVHKKPLLTESDSDYVNLSKSQNNSSKETVLTVEQMDPLIAKTKPKRSDYIVPIVVVILSVPLVAIAISFVYKRSADWWQHRNYKRMDFLIEGIYHN